MIHESLIVALKRGLCLSFCDLLIKVTSKEPAEDVISRGANSSHFKEQIALYRTGAFIATCCGYNGHSVIL